MHIIVYGAGAIGGYLGTRLAGSGHSVALVARAAAAETINAEGLSVTEAGATTIYRLPAYASVEQALSAAAPDLLVLAMKSYDLAPALMTLANCPLTTFLMTTQNGIGVEELVREAMPANPLVTVAVTIPIRRLAVNQLIVEKTGRGLAVATVSATESQLACCVSVLRQAGIETRSLEDYRAMKWSKAFLNIMGNAGSAILGRSPAELYRDPAVFGIEMEMLRETLAIMDRLGLRVVNMPGSKAAPLAFGVGHAPRWLMKPILEQVALRGRGDKMPSFYLDLQAGNDRSEVVFHNGAIAAAAAEVGLPAPVNATLNELLIALTRGERSRAEFNGAPERLIAEIDRNRPAARGKG